MLLIYYLWWLFTKQPVKTMRPQSGDCIFLQAAPALLSNLHAQAQQKISCWLEVICKESLNKLIHLWFEECCCSWCSSWGGLILAGGLCNLFCELTTLVPFSGWHWQGKNWCNAISPLPDLFLWAPTSQSTGLLSALRSCVSPTPDSIQSPVTF